MPVEAGTIKQQLLHSWTKRNDSVVHGLSDIDSTQPCAVAFQQAACDEINVGIAT